MLLLQTENRGTSYQTKCYFYQCKRTPKLYCVEQKYISPYFPYLQKYSCWLQLLVPKVVETWTKIVTVFYFCIAMYSGDTVLSFGARPVKEIKFVLNTSCLLFNASILGETSKCNCSGQQSAAVSCHRLLLGRATIMISIGL